MGEKICFSRETFSDAISPKWNNLEILNTYFMHVILNFNAFFLLNLCICSKGHREW